MKKHQHLIALLLATSVVAGCKVHSAEKPPTPVKVKAVELISSMSGARYSALLAGGYEMGLFEPRPFTASRLADPYADERGSTSSAYRNGKGCLGEKQLIPCDWEWPYQSIQYSLPYNDNNAPTNFKKMAWGSSAFYGTGKSLTRVYDTATTTEPLYGWPNATKKIDYSLCVVLGLTTANGLTRDAAATYRNCANTSPN